MFAKSHCVRSCEVLSSRNVRTRSAALINSEIKIDWCADTFAQCLINGISPRDWKAIFITHSHEDHFCPSELQYSLYPFVEDEYSPFTLFGNSKVIANLVARFPDWPFDYVTTSSFKPFEFAGYKMTPISANHDEAEDCQNLLIESDFEKFLYATDTGIWKEQTWDYLSGAQIGGLVIDCTEGLSPSDYAGHLSVCQCKSVVEKCFKLNILAANAKISTTHHSFRSGLTYENLVSAFEGSGIAVGYDGLEFEIKKNCSESNGCNHSSELLTNGRALRLGRPKSSKSG